MVAAFILLIGLLFGCVFGIMQVLVFSQVRGSFRIPRREPLRII